MRALSLCLIFLFYQSATAAPTVYLPIGSDRHLDLQIDRLFAQTGGTPLTKPYAISEIQLALEKIKHSRPALYQSINRQLARYSGDGKISRIGVTMRHTSRDGEPMANQRGLTSDSSVQGLFEAVWRPNDYMLTQLGWDYRINTGNLVPYNTFVAFSAGNLQLDLGYREHWYSPFKHSAQLISSNAKIGPSITLSNRVPARRWWHLDFDIFYTRLDRVKQGISYQGEWHDGRPHLLGTHISVELVEGWKMGFNRILQFGGGPRKVSVGDILNAFVDPASNDNSYTAEQRNSEFGDQIASITSNYRFDGHFPIEIYAELAGEDTQGASNFSLGNQATNFGIFMPQIYHDVAFRYEYNRFKTAWYTNHLYAYGNTNKGFVIGNYAADQRKFGHGVPAEIHRASIDIFTSLDDSWGASIATINNRDKRLYDRSYELQLEDRRIWRQHRIETALTVGSNVYSQNYTHFSFMFFW